MPVRQHIRSSLMMTMFIVALGALGGCQTTRMAQGTCIGADVPTLDDNACLIPRWIAFAHNSQRANESWRTSVVSHMSGSSPRAELTRAVAFGWSTQSNRLAQAGTLYRSVINQVPDSLRPLVVMWQTDLNERQQYMSLQQQRSEQSASYSASKQAQSTRITELEKSNAELKHKLAEMANIEASMDRRRGAQ